MEKRDYADGTFLIVSYPWGVYHGGRALCSDGQARQLKRIAETADTFFSVPASVRVKGKTVAGYVTVETRKGNSTATDADPAVVKFIAYTYRKNGALLPQGKARKGAE
jgi:hypothetical protein